MLFYLSERIKIEVVCIAMHRLLVSSSYSTSSISKFHIMEAVTKLSYIQLNITFSV